MSDPFYQRIFNRERNARKQAEKLLEEKSLELYKANQSLIELSEGLQKEVDKQTADLKIALNKAEQASHAKSDFVATISHEIRTPLNAIIGFSNIIANNSDLPKAEHDRYIRHICSSSSVLLSLIDDVLDMSKIESGSVVLESIPFDLTEIIGTIVKTTSVLAREAAIVVHTNIESLPYRYVIGDQYRIQQVIFNLISNAIKFSAGNDICVDVLANNGNIEICVIDRGIGISQSAQENLFDAFTQADTSTTRKYGGSGLGLKICKNLVELMSGTITVESVIGEGSTFKCILPLDGTDVLENIDNASLEPHRDVCGLNVLLVDDNPINLELGRFFLEEIDSKVITADGGLEAVQAVKNKSFDIILMDCQMPVCDGFSATIAIREFNASTPIVALTAADSEETRQQCRDAGMTGFLSKPLEPASLWRELYRCKKR